ncbi:LysR family transcriptional regulator [Nocardia huaxiensis]|uniref:LysR family transcriptional regulator n=1 Tax=Nocardia huaxiensis TaxID=2755382 RepID=A0A7D6V7S8_9NOCA|nr:LysR substrate-binding domain-containing protein [Nocardia huaxiensis]QLY29752.1 LysR family transcriptional regulator [Nocardia huaxiensis]
MDVHTRQLRYFVTVAEELSFTRAAQRLYVTQQGLSAQIKQLEQALGVVLFSRTTRNVELTAAGASFFKEVRYGLTRLDAAVERAQSVHRNEQDRLTLGCMEGAALTLTEPILSAFRERHPDVSLELRQFGYDDPSAGLRSGAVDVAIVRHPFVYEGLEFERLFAEPLVVMLPVGHRLAGRAGVLAREIAEEPMLGASCSDPVWNAFWEFDIHREGRPAQIISRSSTLLEELHKVATGQGIVITVACVRWIPFPGVKLSPVIDAEPNEVAVGWRVDHRTALVRSFIDIARTVRDEHPELVAQLEEPDFLDCTLPLHL